MHDLRFGVSYDFRNPPDSGVPNSTLYGEILEQVRSATKLIDRLHARRRRAVPSK